VPLRHRRRGVILLAVRSLLLFLSLAIALSAQSSDTPLQDAVRKGDAAQVRTLLMAGENPNLPSGGRTPLMESCARGRVEIARLLISAGADLNYSSRGEGTALEIAEREGYAEIAALLRGAGARTSGRSVGDKVCVRPWNGSGYCGTVDAIDGNEYRVHVTEVRGCEHGCAAMPDCSAGRRVAATGGLHAGDAITVPVSCLTDTGVQK
jgi:hypothetical protein